MDGWLIMDSRCPPPTASPPDRLAGRNGVGEALKVLPQRKGCLCLICGAWIYGRGRSGQQLEWRRDETWDTDERGMRSRSSPLTCMCLLVWKWSVLLCRCAAGLCVVGMEIDTDAAVGSWFGLRQE